METLCRLTTGGEGNLVTDEFIQDDITYDSSEVQPFVEETDYEADLDSLGQVLDYVMNEGRHRFESDRSDLDAAVAPAVRKFIDVPRRAAGDPGIWHYLAIIWRPDYVRFRWPMKGTTSITSLREKFTKSTEDLYAPAFARLWFMADFTRSEQGSYEPTEKILSRQYISNRLFDRKDLRREAAVQAFAEVAYERDDDEFIDDSGLVEKVALALSHELSSISAEAIESDGVKKLIEQKIGRVKDGS
ncbi:MULTISPECIES: DUF6339 family protein [unclassified Haloferax]|uniref:DUF6339 family protein n=1 Tax=unclassified Haloferax TaxID=2625095 RepID=UPI000E27F4DB|nr:MULTISPECIES: DUF6339 family protein [unclassified Haloferax]RDZ35528.1 hypothetical protein C5B88_14200 [Haloferax sp. Atlit-24N]RLM35940.1 hypothetical protein DVK03_14210 [Haloferax sp. Atlit-109R]RLM43790.1 hypothetical protein DVK04_14210 [Haloferax sp. Atlit-105R]